jgi:hypothetical protein
MRRKLQLTLGCDPELFLADVNGRLKASCGLIGGTKEEPLPLPLGEGYGVQEDNVAVEFNIPPAPNAQEFVRSIGRTLDFLTATVDGMYGFHIHRSSAESFPKEELVSPASQVFGCDPDYNAWTGKKNPRPKARDRNLRSCGGHIHVGGYEKQELASDRLIKCMDLYLGVPSILMDEGELRKELYGKAGAFRDKSYGCEYRTLSNFWVFDERLRQWAWDNTERAVKAAMSQFAIDDYKDGILNAIDNNDKKIAAELVKELELEVVGV